MNKKISFLRWWIFREKDKLAVTFKLVGLYSVITTIIGVTFLLGTDYSLFFVLHGWLIASAICMFALAKDTYANYKEATK